jgi:hypothetical protein
MDDELKRQDEEMRRRIEEKRRKWERNKERRENDREKVLMCPFCKTVLTTTMEIETPYGESVEGGFCGCGTAFVFDRSGRNSGEAYMNAMALAYGWDYEAACEGADGGFEEAVVRFDTRAMRYLKGEGGRFDRSPKYFFIRRNRRPETETEKKPEEGAV